MVTVYHQDGSVTLHHGDCLDVLRTLPDSSVDAVCTDPPYGLEFMGKDWDRFGGDARQPFRGEIQTPDNPYGRSTVRFAGSSSYGARAGAMRAFQAWCESWATECLRVLKPGGHLLAFGGTRTYHRLACAVEDAGFEIRDSIAWLYRSGFPKSLDVSKAIDKAAGATREITGVERTPFKTDLARERGTAYMSAVTGDTRPLDEDGYQLKVTTAPATDAARQWEGWGTALKPAFEPVIVARKPLAGTVAANVTAWGTGALNVDGCRIGAGEQVPGGGGFKGGATSRHEGTQAHASGRWPANVVLDESQAEALDQQSGELKSTPIGFTGSNRNVLDAAGRSGSLESRTGSGFTDSGGASRFFFVAREDDSTLPIESLASRSIYTAKADAGERVRVNGAAHPTVKPLSLMRWLARLVTPPGGLVLEPFAGSGTTVEACILEGFHCVAIERETDYLPLIVQRVNRQRDPIAYTATAGDDLGLFGLLDGDAS